MYFICKFCKLFVNVWKVGKWRVISEGKWKIGGEDGEGGKGEVGIRWWCGVGTTDPFSSNFGNFIHILPPGYDLTLLVNIWQKLIR